MTAISRVEKRNFHRCHHISVRWDNNVEKGIHPCFFSSPSLPLTLLYILQFFHHAKFVPSIFESERCSHEEHFYRNQHKQNLQKISISPRKYSPSSGESFRQSEWDQQSLFSTSKSHLIWIIRFPPAQHFFLLFNQLLHHVNEAEGGGKNHWING